VSLLPKARVLGSPISPASVSPALVRREPLPPFPGPSSDRGNRLIWSDGPYNTDIKADVNDPRFLVGNFCGLRDHECPGYDAPAFFTFCLDRMPLDKQQKFLTRYASCGYNVVQQSVYQQRVENHQSLEQFIATQKRIQSFSQQTDIWWVGGPDEGGRPLQYYIDSYEPWIDALIAAKAMDRGCIAWQADGSFHPRGLQELIEWMSSKFKPAGIPLSLHWRNSACALFDGRDDPYEHTIASMHPDPNDPLHGLYSSTLDNWRNWHKLNNRFIDYHHLQVDVWASILGIQKAIEVLLSATNIVLCEYCAQNSFDGQQTEVNGDLMGRLALGAAGGPFKLLGLYNGGRLEDGSAVFTLRKGSPT
jgi:hypothetical protein